MYFFWVANCTLMAGGHPGRMEKNVQIVACNASFFGKASRYNGRYREERQNNDALYHFFEKINWDCI